MSIKIEDGTGKGYQVKINSNNQLKTQAEIHELQHEISREKGQVYQIIGKEASVAATTQTLLHVKNISDHLSMVISYM